jgi:ERF superfamily
MSHPETGVSAQMIETDASNMDAPPKPDQRAAAVPAVAFEHSEQINEIVSAVSKAQVAFTAIERNHKAEIQTRGGSSFGFAFEDMAAILEAIRPALEANGLAVMQFPVNRQGGILLITMLAHQSGQWFRSQLAMPCNVNDSHAVGSAISYARRYSVKPILGLAPAPGEDDDAEAARASMYAGPPQGPKAGQRASAQVAASANPPAGEKPKPGKKPEPRAAAPKAPEPSPTPSPAPAKTMAPIGPIATIAMKGPGALVTLDTGFVAATRDAELIKALQGHHANGRAVELSTRASSDPSKYAPTILEITVQQA